MTKEILNLAKQYGFDNCEKVGRWKRYDIYAPFNNDGSRPCIGQPVFILFNDDETRVATESEWTSFIRFLKD